MTRSTFLAAVVLTAFLVAAPPGYAAWTWPLRGEVITQYRNGDDPYAAGQHRGIDIAGPVGASVVAATPGEVRFAGVAGVSGLTVSLRTADGRYDTSYLHLSAASVREGDTVAAGDRIGAVGTSGTRAAAAPHLHFGVRDAGSDQAYHDPLQFLPPLATTGAPAPSSPAGTPEGVPSVPTAAPAPVDHSAAVRAPSRASVSLPKHVHAKHRSTAPARTPRLARHGAQNHRRPAPASGYGRALEGAPGRADAQHRQSTSHPRGASQGHGAPHPQRASHLRADPRRGAGHVGRHAAAHTTPHVRPPSRHTRRHAGAAATESRRQASPADDPPSAAGGGGPNAGWALACLGLLAAAALVGTSGGGRDVVRRRGAVVAKALRPLLGRG